MKSPLCVFVTLDNPEGHLIDDLLCAPYFEEAGWDFQSWVWTQPQDWSQPDLIVLRSCYDYWEDPKRFEAFLCLLEGSPAKLVNPAPLVRWNTNKRYLFDLEQLGIPVVPGTLLEPAGSEPQITEFLGHYPGVESFIVKPLIAAGGFAMQKLSRAELAGFQPDSPLLLQPFLDTIHQGEWSTIFLGGEPSHVICKTAREGEYRVQDCHGGSARAADWGEHPGLLQASLDVCAALEHLGLPKPCYARYDFLPYHGRLLLMEAELIEPTLFLAEHPPAARAFVRILTELESLSNQQGETVTKNEKAVLVGRPASDD